MTSLMLTNDINNATDDQILDNLVILKCSCFRNLFYIDQVSCNATSHICVCPCNSIKKVDKLICLSDYHIDIDTINEFNDMN